MACDICGKTGVSLESLHNWYQTDDIKEMCSECEKKVNDQLLDTHVCYECKVSI